VPTALGRSEGNMMRFAKARSVLTPRGRRPWARLEAFCTGTGRSPVCPWKIEPGDVLGTLRGDDSNERAGEVGQTHSTEETAEQGAVRGRSAEAVEGRGLTKGKAFHQNKHRTQGRGRGRDGNH